MADELVAQGQLINLFDVNYPGNYGYYGVVSEEKVEEPRVSAFWEWLISEAKDSLR
jgi:hypothetical protein